VQRTWHVRQSCWSLGRRTAQKSLPSTR
jgi:hypothetical protein